MPHRRPSRNSKNSKSRASRRSPSSPVLATAARVSFGVEPLEERRMLTTFTGTGVYQYVQANGADCEIIYNDVTFEAIANAGGAAANLVPFVLPPGTQPPGLDLFKIYVTQSSTDSYIAITSFNPANGHLLPYTGAITNFGSTDTAGNAPYTVGMPSGTGAVTLGDPAGVNANGIPSIPLTSSFGLQPAPEDGELTAGIEVEAINPATDQPNNFGNFLVGGTVFGQVYFGGNVNEFYAGAVITGVLTGGPETLVGDSPNAGLIPTTAPLAPVVPTNAPASTTPTPTSTATPPSYANFSVAGDLREFLTLGPVGTDTKGTAADPTWVSDFAMTVGGTLGEMHVGNGLPGDFAGTVQVEHSKSIASGIAPAGDTFYDPGIFTPQLKVQTLDAVYVGSEFGEGEVDLPNETIGEAQVLGSIPEISATSGLPVTDAEGNIVYEADVQAQMYGVVPNVGVDTTDYYAMAFQAGQTFTVTAFGGVGMTVYDPDGREVASNTEDAASPLQITPDRPGLYKFELTDPSTAAITYELVITNTGDLGIGGIVGTGFCTDNGYDSGIALTNGDIGTINFAGAYASLTDGPTPSSDADVPIKAPTSIGVYAGSLRDFEAAAMGVASTDGTNTLFDGAYLNIPYGGVGLIRTTGGLLDLNTQFDQSYLELTTPQYVTNTANATAIGGSIQVIDAAGSFQGLMAVDGGIGTVDAGDMATGIPSYFDINADNKGDDGIIDLIDVTGNLGEAGFGGPQFVTNDGGQVRYMECGGTVYPDIDFGAEDQAVTGAFGQTLSFTDQAGNRVTVTPRGRSRTPPTPRAARPPTPRRAPRPTPPPGRRPIRPAALRPRAWAPPSPGLRSACCCTPSGTRPARSRSA